MAVQIKELVIRAVVDYPNDESESIVPAEEQIVDQSELVKACVKQVLEILKQQQKR